MIKSNKADLELEFGYLMDFFGAGEIEIEHEEIDAGACIKNRFTYGTQKKVYEFEYEYSPNLTDLAKKSIRKSLAKVHLYDILSKELKKTLPWGSLTGVRPTKFARTLIENGGAREAIIAEVLERDYRVRKDKARLVAQTLKNQRCIIRNDNLVDLYVNIPICPSRCLYCSFISNELERVKDKIDTYLDCVIVELDAVKKIIAKKAYIVRTIYIGGGTPSVLSAEDLDRLLSALNFPVGEFTVECGRPDTITREKLEVLNKHKVTRMSINPQTFCEATLKRIGRKHKNAQVFEAYQMAMELGLKVNMDVIAGLPGEKFGTFKRTIQTLIDLNPENITVHTLSVKNGARLRDEKDILSEKDVPKMVEYAQTVLQERGYKPYYMYRQKNQLCGLENVGYFRDDNVCIFNIDSMEDTNTIIAVGAGAMSKRVFNLDNRIERQPNCKFIEDYIARIDEMIEKKKEFYK